MKSLKRHEGYLLIDHRNSPGITPEFLRGAGIEAPAVGAGITFEAAIISCSHCQNTVILNPERTRARNYCSKCDHYVCDNPGCIVECVPMQKVIDEYQNAALLIDQGE